MKKTLFLLCIFTNISIKIFAQNQTRTATINYPMYTVGQQAQGGIVVFVDESGQHGLVASPADIPIPQNTTGISWGIAQNTPAYSMAMGGGIFDGEENTSAIVSQYSQNTYAAFLCRQNSFGNYGDWYLPSIGELAQMMHSKNLLHGLTINYGYYWSSTEATPTTAYLMLAYGETWEARLKTEAFNNGVTAPYRVRSVRRF